MKSMRTFLIVWAGQLVSMMGSSLTGFAAGLWLYTETNSVTNFALANVFYLLPMALLSPVAGAIVDDNDRRLILILSDVVQAIATVTIGLIFFFGVLQPWHLYVMITLSAAAGAFQGPAWQASIPLLVPKEQLGRASGLGRTSQAIARVASPALAGGLLLTIGLGGILLIDAVTFLVGVGTVLVVRIPNPPPNEEEEERANLWERIRFGWGWLTARRGLFVLVIMVSLLNLFVNFAGTLMLPIGLILANEAVVGVLASAAGGAMLIATLIMSAWGGPQKRVWFVSLWIMVQGAAIALAGLRPNLWLLAAGYLGMTVAFGFISTNYSPILQTKVDPAVQGRVFALTSFLAMVLEPLGQLIVGPLADRIMEPAMAEGGALAGVFGPVLGVGPGRGMGLIMVAMGLAIVALGAYGFIDPRVRNLEDDLPDLIPDEAAAPAAAR